MAKRLNELTRQLLTVLMDPVSEFDAQDEFGFTVLFTQTEPPGMLCLCTQPWNSSVDGSLADHWMNLDGSECLEIQSDASHPGRGGGAIQKISRMALGPSTGSGVKSSSFATGNKARRAEDSRDYSTIAPIFTQNGETVAHLGANSRPLLLISPPQSAG
ncbi:uncharacterized protein BDW43DRAFT_32093 [Aspergillus alliaceus]|uniref:uncharacterized protein n=1 Tax=Petromyces alliaceus TaxID=209559 RepID=UPI0012A6DB79|nr:uncharacterized protein BDW43DRAFT_32093 [Aspergillus alliaceus]KAB8235390.1 hypothetical protein BDW43DRAFT_32093 [Aspergillus alliaceus]